MKHAEQALNGWPCLKYPLNEAKSPQMETSYGQSLELMGLREENTTLKEQIKELEEKFYIVNWYIEVMESGGDIKQMTNFYRKSKQKMS